MQAPKVGGSTLERLPAAAAVFVVSHFVSSPKTPRGRCLSLLGEYHQGRLVTELPRAEVDLLVEWLM